MTQEEIERQAEELKDEECKKLLSSDKGYNGLTIQDFWKEGFIVGAKRGMETICQNILEEFHNKSRVDQYGNESVDFDDLKEIIKKLGVEV